MFGSAAGNFFGTAYFLYFQLAGILLAALLLKKEQSFVKILLGSVFGSVLIMWLPCLFSFIFDFSAASHFCAAAVVFPVFIAALKSNILSLFDFKEISSAIKQNRIFCLFFTATFVLWCYLLNTHIIPPVTDAGLWTGQCTYGDMNMHLGFITSIAKQGIFPPEYSLFPGTKLAYPFLNAAISSSVYIFGASLRWSYILPMLFAFVQIMGFVYITAQTVLADKAKSVFTFILYFFNGGLGFIYFTGLSAKSNLQFADIFNGYYTTPTNLIGFNIRWVNIIADILLPQRASLFGYSVLFACILLLYKAVWKNKSTYFVYAAILASSLPMIHTHSFLAIGLISAAWLLMWLYNNQNTKHNNRCYSIHFLIAFTVLMCIIQQLNKNGHLTSKHFMAIGLTGIGCCVFYGVYQLYNYIKLNGYKKILSTWGIYLIIVLILALPQLFFWTFGQVSEGGFLRGHFNWGNLGDFYPWFYLKNIGIPLLLIIGAIWKCSKKVHTLIIPAAVIWFVAEFILFTPNTYDNNKLLYIAYLLLCIAISDFAVDLYRQIKAVKHGRLLSAVAAVCCVFLCTFSAILTLGREAVSGYQLYSQPHLELAEFIEYNTNPTDVIMTNTRHNNEIVSLTGRNTVCGSDIFLYYHGIDTTQRKADLALMYQQPSQNDYLFEKYDVNYVVVSSWERSDYNVDENYFATNFKKIFSNGGVDLYKVK